MHHLCPEMTILTKYLYLGSFGVSTWYPIFWVTRCPMIFEPESGRARYKKILDSRSGSGTHWALIATIPCFRLVNCLRRKGCPYDRASTLFIFITIIITIIIITRPKPAYDRQGLAAISLRASGAQLGRGK